MIVKLHWTFGVILVVATLFAAAEDWPTYRHDNQRSGVTGEHVDITQVQEAWVWRSAQWPQPAWPGPAKWDAFSGKIGLRAMRNFDAVFYTTVVGNQVVFGSNVEDTVRCLNTADGAEQWRRTVDGAVRMPPAWHDGHLYFGADDGVAYCIAAKDGAVQWRFNPAKSPRQIPSNGKLIAESPVRTGILLDSGKAYFGASLSPWTPSYLCAVDAATGKAEGEGTYVIPMTDVTLEGALLASPNKLYAQQGRHAPLIYDKATGKELGAVSEGGGVFAVLTPEGDLIHSSRSQKEDFVAVSSGKNQDRVSTYDKGNYMIVHGSRAYILMDDKLLAIDRASGETVWEQASDCPLTLIKAGDTLWAGGINAVAAFHAEDGAPMGRLTVDGKAYGITIANGGVFVSTDLGVIHCFR